MLRQAVALLLMTAAVTLRAQQCSSPPCFAFSGLASYVNRTTNCCSLCPQGHSCNGTTAVACSVPQQFQDQVAQVSCRNTTVCTFTQFQLRPPTLSTNRRCQELLACIAGVEYERAPPTATSDRLCTLLRTCASGKEYEMMPPTATSDRDCRAITQCNAISETTQHEATPTSDAQCTCRPNFVQSAFNVGCTSCQNFVGGCDTCEMRNKTVSCTRCLLGMQPVALSDGLRCVSCETAHCYECDQNNVCVSCKQGFRRSIQTDGAAVCICGMMGCASCNDDGTCHTCQMGFRLVNDTCICDRLNCAKCDGFGRCAACNPGWTLNASKECVCSTPGCLQCAPDASCLACNASFRLTVNRTCQCALAGCAECSADGSCARCSGALQLNATLNKCVCNIGNCIRCTEDGSSCLECKVPLTAVDGKCVCALGQCAECNSTGCARCAVNFTLTAAGECVANTTTIADPTVTANRAASAMPWIGIAGGVLTVCIIVMMVNIALRRMNRTAAKTTPRAESPLEIPYNDQSQMKPRIFLEAPVYEVLPESDFHQTTPLPRPKPLYEVPTRGTPAESYEKPVFVDHHLLADYDLGSEGENHYDLATTPGEKAIYDLASGDITTQAGPHYIETSAAAAAGEYLTIEED